jgi:hypothetical protein
MLIEIFWVLLMLGMIVATIVVALRERKPQTKSADSGEPSDPLLGVETFGEDGLDDSLPDQELGEFEFDQSARK